jgi:hypothetical protein
VMTYLPMHFFATVQFNVRTLLMSTQHYLRMFETQSGTAFRGANNCAIHFLPIARALSKKVNNRHQNGSLFFQIIETMTSWYIIPPNQFFFTSAREARSEYNKITTQMIETNEVHHSLILAHNTII